MLTFRPYRSGLSQSDKLVIETTVPIGIITLAIMLIGLYLQHQAWRHPRAPEHSSSPQVDLPGEEIALEENHGEERGRTETRIRESE
jgi:hypothetical protein